MSFNKPLKGILKLKVVVRAKTGLHIGGAKENVEIGGIDNIVEKLKIFFADRVEPPSNGNSVIALSFGGSSCQCGTCKICKLFGVHQAKNIQEPVRLRFDDFYPTPDTLNLWETTLDSGYVEVKVENMINRIKGVAENPRHTERVIAGSEFEGYITLRIFEDDDLEKFLETLKNGFEMLEDDYLGGSGSRGYGRVEIRIEDYEYKKIEGGKYRKVEEDEEVEKAVNEQLGLFLKREHQNAQTV